MSTRVRDVVVVNGIKSSPALIGWFRSVNRLFHRGHLPTKRDGATGVFTNKTGI